MKRICSVLYSVVTVSSFLLSMEQVVEQPVTSSSEPLAEWVDLLAPEQKKLVEAYVAYVNELNNRCSNPARLVCSATQLALTRQTNGGIFALAHLKKAEKSLTFISCSGLTLDLWYSQDVLGEELAKSLIVPYFSVWAQAKEPVVLLLETPHGFGYNYASELQYLEKCSHTYYSGTVPVKVPTLDLLIHTLAELCFKEGEAYRFGSLSIEFIERVRDPLVRNGALSFIASPQVQLFKDLMGKINQLFLNLFAQRVFKNEDFYKKLLQPENALQPMEFEEKVLQSVISSSLGKSKDVTLAEFLDLLSKYRKVIEAALPTIRDTFIKKELQRAGNDLLLQAHQLPEFFALHAPQWQKISLERFFLDLIKGARTFPALRMHIQKIQACQFLVWKIVLCAVITDLLSRYKHVVYLNREAACEATMNFFKAQGFYGDEHGVIAHAEEIFLHAPSPFRAPDVVSFLDTVTQKIDPDYAFITDPRYYPYNPFVIFTEDPFLPDEIRAHSPEQLRVGRTTLYLDYQKSPSVRAQSFLDMTTVSCLECEKSFSRARSFASIKEKGDFCSSSCFVKAYVRQIDPLQELLQRPALLGEDKKVLQQLAALCALRYLALAPTARFVGGLFYQLRHAAIKDLLKVLIAHGSTHHLWSKTLALAETLSLDIQQLSIFCELYSRIKKEYHVDLLSYARCKRYQDLLCESAPDLDQRGRIYTYQQKQYETFCAAFHLSDRTSSETAPVFYFELLKRLQQRVSFSFDAIESLLTFERAPEDDARIIEGCFPLAQKAPIFKRISTSLKVQSSIQDDEALVEIDWEAPSEIHEDVQSEPSDLSKLEVAVKDEVLSYRDIRCLFAHRIPYTIRLYEAASAVPEEAQTGRSLWNCCRRVRESYRIQTILALAHEIESGAPLSRTSFGTYVMQCVDDRYDATITSKLDLHHLFPSTVDAFVRQFGVAEIVEGSLVQLSVPGEIHYSDGLRERGFFQLTYIPGSWTCIHRCFKIFNNQKSDYVSAALRILFDKITKRDSV